MELMVACREPGTGLECVRFLFSSDDHQVQQRAINISLTLPRRRDWSEIPRDICRLITDKIGFTPHLHKFASTCKEWHTIATEQNRYSPPPTIMLPFNKKMETCRFVTLEGRHSKSYDLKIPELKEQYWICGSSNGWLTLADVKLNLVLFNPLTRAKVPLPKLPFRFINEYLASRLEDTYECPDSFVGNAIISDKLDPNRNPSSLRNCVVAISISRFGNLAFCRPCDESWSVFTSDESLSQLSTLAYNASDHHYPQDECFSDFIFHEGRIYAVRPDCHVLIWDYDGVGDIRYKRIKVPHIPDDSKDLKYFYVVNSCGTLLVVMRYLNKLTNKFKVYGLDKETETWRHMTNLGGQSLLVGANQSLSVSATDMKLEKDCIYFLDDNDERYYSPGQSYELDNGIFTLPRCQGYQLDNGIFSLPENRVIQRFDIQHYLTFWTEPAMWFVPNP